METCAAHSELEARIFELSTMIAETRALLLRALVGGFSLLGTLITAVSVI